MLDHCARSMAAAGRLDPRYYAESRPVLAEAEATRRAIDYAALVDAEIYIVHLSCAPALEAVSAARKRGIRVWAETRPIYLALTDDRYRAGGTEAAKVVGAPPLRSALDQAALWDGLRSGDIQAIGSDNTSWTVEQKAAGAADFTRVPYGVPGLETEMRVIYSEGVASGRISLQTYVAAFATNPARIFGLYPQKGTIAVGSDADFVLFDPARPSVIDERQLHSRAGYDPFHGLPLRGGPVMTISRGEVVARNGQLLGRPGRGRHLLRHRAAAGA
jgi:dihydropyrimidinase